MFTVAQLSSHQRRCRRYHSSSSLPLSSLSAAASGALSSVCSTVDDVNTSGGVAETNRPRRRSMHRTKRSRCPSFVDRSMSRSHCLLVAICMREGGGTFVWSLSTQFAFENSLCATILKPRLHLPIAQAQLHRELPSVLGREVFVIREPPFEVLRLLGREADLSALPLRPALRHQVARVRMVERPHSR